MEINWTQVFEIVGALYLVLTALAGFCTLLASATARWPGVSKVFAVVATVCGTIAGALHKVAPSKPKDAAVVLVLLVCAASPTACLAGSFEEARLAGVREKAIASSVAKWETPRQALDAAKLAEIAAAPSDYCTSLDNGQLWFRAIGTGLTLASGPTVVPAFVLPEDNADTKRAFIVAAGVAGVAGGVLLMLGDGKATAWVRDCSQAEAAK